ncbi:hypothetical protein NDU88_007186 [Pleurodeles waltl]|uniref:Uncharacterized protein n=1 Tax=Pleurodeles waltl TaxID=8319 RepID=A0AAV7QR56_PLEWA|nr:hypothetical protein NDU88_007186 [Pleurodeles waltl]
MKPPQPQRGDQKTPERPIARRPETGTASRPSTRAETIAAASFPTAQPEEARTLRKSPRNSTSLLPWHRQKKEHEECWVLNLRTHVYYLRPVP